MEESVRRSSTVQHDVKMWRPAGLEGLELTRTRTTLTAQPRHFHGEYQIGVIEQGEGVFHYRGERHTVHAGLIAVVQAGEAHACFTNAPQGWSFSVLYADPNLINDLLPETRGPRVMVFSSLCFRNVTLARALVSFVKYSEKPLGQLEQESRLLGVLADVIRYGATPSFPGQLLGQEPRAVALVKEYLQTHIGEDVTLSDLAVLTSLSRFYLLRHFTNTVGMTPHDYQTSLRIESAKALLRNGELLARVAAEMGFADQPHFSKTFKKLVGMTPGQYRAA